MEQSKYCTNTKTSNFVSRYRSFFIHDIALGSHLTISGFPFGMTPMDGGGGGGGGGAGTATTGGSGDGMDGFFSVSLLISFSSETSGKNLCN